jgi:uncharacterized protein (DUF608 family)
MLKPERPQKCDSSSCGCHGSLSRREFVEILGCGAAAALTTAMPVMAGPFETKEFEKLVPVDKKLDPAWVKSLTARGARTVYRGAELEKIGMPIGGICAGQVYLGGDGTLWHWDIFNQQIGTGDGNYAHPPRPASPLAQGFGLRVTAGGKTAYRPLSGKGFAEVTFAGEYPIGLVEYRDPATPVAVSLEAFSPFVPLDAEQSSLPATILRFTVKNTGSTAVEAELIGWLENAVCLHTKQNGVGQRQNRIVRQPGALLLDCSVHAPEAAAASKSGAPRADIAFEDFQKETYEGWTVTGEAFGRGPILKSQIPSYQGDVGSKGPRVVNSHASAPGANVAEKDQKTGTLTSRPFTIERNFITFWIGGGNNPGKTCINLVVDGKVVRSATGHDSNQMRQDSFEVRNLQGKTARLELVDRATSGWGNIGAAEMVFTDKPPKPASKLEEQFDYGTMALGLLQPQASDAAAATVSQDKIGGTALPGPALATERLQGQLVGALSRKLALAPGQAATATFVIAWHFPNLQLKDGGRHYATRFPAAADVAAHIAANLERLSRETQLWHDTWYDSTLPYWFLDRTLANASILATSTCHWFKTGRFYGWEGVGCCEGTCTHVWHYAHAVGRLFPALERDLRRRTDFGTAIHPDGIIEHRGESCGLAVDGQAGCILRAYREHQMSSSDGFLKEIWPKVKLAMLALVRMDDGRGMLEGPQHNTLDQPWFGRVAWLSSLYVAAARACEEMAREMGDEAFAGRMHAIVGRSGNIDRELFNGDYYLQIADKDHLRTVGSHDGCEIDQVFGQSWAYQVGLGRILDAANVKKALAALWRYNFTPDVGPFRKHYTAGRWYAMAGEGGLLMCSWPHGDKSRVTTGFDFYFNECMTGFEYQVAGHMIWEGMVQEGLAVTRAIHDRYHAARRNPWNEVECGDHYARAMASYGVFLAACGYEYHGPKGYLAFSPCMTPEDFRAAFTTAEGWGTFQQTRSGGTQREAIEVKWGKLRLRTLAFTLPEHAKPGTASVVVAGKAIPSTHATDGQRIVITLGSEVIVETGQKLEIEIA